MPLIIFSVNTATRTLGEAQALGMGDDGTFRMSHRLKESPHPDTQYTLKHVFINAGGSRTGTTIVGDRNLEPCLWADFHFPQLVDGVITRTDDRLAQFETTTPVSVNSGMLRFPITTYPITGESGLDSNAPGRSGTINFSQFFQHTGTHVCDIPLGSMRLEDNVIECVMRPLARFDRQLVDADTVAGDLWPRIRNMQIILEYK